MHVLEGADHLFDDLRDVLLAAAHAIHEFPALDELHQQEDVVLIAEVAVQLHDVGMIEVVQNLQLQTELSLHSVLQKHRFKDLLQGEHHTSQLVFAQVHLPEFTRTHLLAQLEVTQTQGGKRDERNKLFLLDLLTWFSLFGLFNEGAGRH